ncbi:EF-hand domain-containing protein [Ideonella sp. BN130291]|uniref:EF-hand domain-containing protein n=1 Tax=Ideonella sp. BN130291 TaxID=3112940 RepID=UPI002E271F50|nr:EF-hand domain-containing protein [Ideonella sp. BN130291]
MPVPLVRFGFAAALSWVVQAGAAEPPPALRDPWVPPATQARAAAQPPVAPSSGATLQAQVERKLRQRFAAADTAGTGRITREQARAVGLGRVADDFEQIDRAHTGSISFEDVKRHLRASAR